MEKFKLSENKLVFDQKSIKDFKTDETIAYHYFNYKIGCIIPDIDGLDSATTSSITDNHAYIVYDVPLGALLSEEFIGAFVKKGRMSMLSHGTKIDTDDCAAFLPGGFLILNITKDTFEELGLEGVVSEFCAKRPYKYVIKIDFKSKYFQPGKKSYERVKWCFTEKLELKFNFLISWNPFADRICPSSVAAYFRSKEYRCCRLKTVENHRLYSASVPIMEFYNTLGSDACCHNLDVYEWLGGVSCGVDLDSGGPDNYLTTLCCPSPSVVKEKLLAFSWEGYFSTNIIADFLQKLRTLLETNKLPWISATVHGFADSPVSWQMKENGFLKNGDNLYTVILFPDDLCWIYKALGPHFSMKSTGM